MAKGYTTRKLQVFALHARSESTRIDYPQLFKQIASLAPDQRFLDSDGRVIAIPTCEVRRGSAWLIAYEGDLGVNPLIYSTSTAKERVQKLRSGEVVAHKTHALFDLKRRESIVEYNHRGAKTADISSVLESLARVHLDDPTVAIELNPVADEEFSKAIGHFGRIRVATLRVARPNIDWTDHYSNLTAFAKESEARTIEVSVTASRGGSLSRRTGIVRYITDLAREGLSILKGARVIGIRENESEETTLSLAHHIEHQKVNVRMTADGHVDDGDVREKIESYLAARALREDRP